MKKMAVHHQNNNIELTSNSFSLDTLYCEEEKWEDNEDLEQQQQDEDVEAYFSQNGTKKVGSFFPISLLEQDLFWEDGELLSLFTKEEELLQFDGVGKELDSASLLSVSRQQAVEWILKVNSHYGFSTVTAVLAINYLDRFISCPCYYHRDKPWMIQLVAVTCLSLAAKVEETQVPLLLDLQVKDTKYVFEAKTVQRMELLVLSTLEWKMLPVTPLSFLDHIIRRLGLKTSLHWEFLRRCERLLLNLVSDSRSTCFLPSVLATATMMHVIGQVVEPFNPIDYQNQLLGVLKINKEKVNDCYEVICEVIKRRNNNGYGNGYNNDQMKSLKRKYESLPGSPSGVIDAVFSCDSSNDSWAMVSSSVSSSPRPLFKKNKGQDQWVFVDIVGNGTPH